MLVSVFLPVIVLLVFVCVCVNESWNISVFIANDQKDGVQWFLTTQQGPAIRYQGKNDPTPPIVKEPYQAP